MTPLLVMGAIAAGASLLGSVFNAAGNYQASKAEEEQALEEARLAREAAQQTRIETEWKIGDLQTQQRQFMGTQKALIGRSGVKLSSGSPLALLGETARRRATDVQRMRQQGQWEAEALEAEAGLYEKQARAYQKTRPWQLAGSLLGGISSGAGILGSVL